MKQKNDILQSVLDKSIDNKKVFGTSFCIKYKGDCWLGASGNLQIDDQFFIASTTKLYITAIILHLQSKGILNITDKISHYLNENLIKNLVVINGEDFSEEITIKNLLAHTSGIADYFQQKNGNGKSLEQALMEGNDQSWTPEQAIETSKKLQSKFKPNEKNKAFYSDTNFQLLGLIIENITKKSLAENYHTYIFNPLNLSETYLYQDVQDQRPKTFYYKNNELYIPKAMASFGADGGIVSTSKELQIFLEAFFNGKFFPTSYIDKMQVWNKIFNPFKSGIGIHQFKLPWYFNPFGTIPELIGHSGLSGTIAYHSPEKDLYVAGTVNQVAYPDTSFRLMIKLLVQIFKEKK